MANQKYQEYLKTKEWAEVRVSIIESRKCCERCGKKKNLQVHHKTYKNIFKEEPEDLELLCAGCHYGEHFKPVKKKKHTKRSKKRRIKYPFGLSLAQKVEHKKKNNKEKMIRKRNLKIRLGIKSKYQK